MVNRLRWNGNIRAQKAADKAYAKLKPKQKKMSKSRRRKQNKRQCEKIEYHKYIKSKAWYHVREQVLRRSGYKCVRCGSSSGLQVHHRTYVRLGREKMRDLEVLCRYCHENEHQDKVLETDPLSVLFRSIVS